MKGIWQKEQEKYEKYPVTSTQIENILKGMNLK
jgi:hypothetical protein